ncbi:hypothetical protein Ancab_024119 [Ancistrocladus abbreviatus]
MGDYSPICSPCCFGLSDGIIANPDPNPRHGPSTQDHGKHSQLSKPVAPQVQSWHSKPSYHPSPIVALANLPISILPWPSLPSVLPPAFSPPSPTALLGGSGEGSEGSNHKLYYGIATFKGLYVFNTSSEDWEDDGLMKEALMKYRIRLIDFVHAFVSLFVFLMFALSDGDVLDCCFPEAGG